MRLTVLFPAFLLSACLSPASQAEQNKTLPMALNGFQSVSLMGPDDVHVTVGQSFSVRATGPAQALDRLDIRVENGDLKVSRKPDRGDWARGSKEGKVRIDVTMPEISGAALSGAGDLRVENAQTPGAFSGSLSGAGDLRVTGLQAQSVSMSLSGSGDVRIAGVAQALKARLSGSGDVDVRDLPVKTVALSLSGVGDLQARVSDRAEGSLSGVGDIEVIGGAVCAIHKTGVGSVHCGGQAE